MTNLFENASTDPALALHIAQYYLNRRQLDNARAMLLPLLSVSEEGSAASVSLAASVALLCRAYLARRRLDDATALLHAARPLGDASPLLRVQAELTAASGDDSGAIELLRRAAASEPENGEGWLALARACEAASDHAGAVSAYLHAARVAPTHATILTAADRVSALAPQVDADTPAAGRVRIAIIGSSTLEYVKSYLEVACRLAGLAPAFYLGPYGQYAQDILDPGSALYTFAPDVVIVAIHGQSFFPDRYESPVDLDVPARRAAAEQVVERMASLLARLTAHTQAHVLLHTFATPQYSPLGTLDLRDELGQTAFFQLINSGIAARVRRDFPSVHLVDEDRVYGRVGKRNVTDPRMWFLARIGIGEGVLSALTAEYMRCIKAAKGRARKCLVLDLDNTLWGGVVGEDGPTGIALGQEAPGNAFVAFQEAILSLYKRGIILAINSKNNEADAREVLEHHPDMVLRPHHFAAMRINWQDKAANLRDIAAELNIGLDSLVFMDDNPAECALVRSRLPEVLTIHLPNDPALYRATLLDLTDFDSLALTEEDRMRGQLYAQRRERQSWEAGHAGNLDDYLGELEMVVEVAPADDFAIPRVAQLIGKTNQFNLTTRRHTETAVRSFAGSDDSLVYSVRASDRFGEHGLVGAAILRANGDIWEVDTLLLSCRVLGRGVETAILSALVSAAREGGAHLLRGLFIPTAKNAPARDFYSRHGFHLAAEEDTTQMWELDVRAEDVATPAWLTLRVPRHITA